MARSAEKVYDSLAVRDLEVNDIELASGATIDPLSDSTTALQIRNAAGASIMSFDTTNSRVIIGASASTPAEALHISGGNLSITRVATTAPTTPVAGTGTLFISGGDLNYIGPAGTLTRVAIG